MYLDNSVSLGEEMERQFDQMGIDKGMPMEERMKAFNSNVSQSFHSERQSEGEQMGRQGMLSVDAGDFAAKQGGGRKWLIGDYEAGDAVFHHSCE